MSRRSHVLPISLGGVLLLGIWLLPPLGVVARPELLSVQLARGQIERLGEASASSGGPLVRVRILDGPNAGQSIDAMVQGPLGGRDAPYQARDEVLLLIPPGPPGSPATISDRWRAPALAVLAAFFALTVLIVGGWRGARALLALGLTLALSIKVFLPLVLAGWDPVALALGTAALVTIVTVYLTEGSGRVSLAAVLGTISALILTGILGTLFAALAQFTELQASEDAAYLAVLGLDLDLRGLLLAAVILGALGVLDDVTVTQAAVVKELHLADLGADARTLFSRAMNVGRSHIAATINTLILAYVGASLPLLALFAAGRHDALLVASSEMVAVEIVRSLVGSIGIVAAVPLTTVIAAYLLPRGSAADHRSLGDTSQQAV